MRAAWWLTALVACTLACAPEPAPSESASEPQLVIARVGAASRAAPMRPPQSAEAKKLATLTRNAVAGSDAFEVEVPAQASRLEWSQAVVCETEARGRVAFEVALTVADGDGSTLSRAESEVGAGWQDHTAALPSPGTARTLRFTTGPAPCPEATPFWGSIRFLGALPGEARPNVVLISLDTLGASYLGSFSGESDVSPRLDHFLAESASFRRAYAQYGNTLVSHASLFSALQPKHHGVYPDGLPVLLSSSLVEALAAAGYETAALTEGAFVSAAFGFARGFDRYDDGAIGLSRQVAGGAAATFERAGHFVETQGSDRRFFLFVHSYEVHSPYLPRDPASLAVASRRTPGDERIPTQQEQGLKLLLHNAGRAVLSPRDLARLAALHVGEVHGLDALVGRFLERLAGAGLAEHTIVVITSDHGDQFGEGGKVGHGDSLHDRVLHVPLAFRWPGVIAPQAIDTPIPLVDAMPTLLELLALPVPGGLDGTSHAAALRGAAPFAERPVFSEQRSARGECAQLGLPTGCRLDRLAVHEGRWKLVTSQRPPWERLHDLAQDPLETRDVATEHPDTLARLRALADAYRASAAGAPQGGEPGAVDADTLQRLRDLGYVPPGDPR